MFIVMPQFTVRQGGGGSRWRNFGTTASELGKEGVEVGLNGTGNGIIIGWQVSGRTGEDITLVRCEGLGGSGASRREVEKGQEEREETICRDHSS